MKMTECLTPKTKVVEGKRNKDNVINQRKSPKGEKSSVDKKKKTILTDNQRERRKSGKAFQRSQQNTTRD